MARATRSQPQPSQSQPRHRVGRATNGRSQPVDDGYDDDKDDDVDAGDYDDGMDVDDEGRGDDSQKELERKAGDLARLALFAESRRVPLKRDEISKKDCANILRLFSPGFEFKAIWPRFRQSQEILRKTFGIEMGELQTRAALAQDADEPEPTQAANGANGVNGAEAGKKGKKTAGAGKRAPAGGAKTYILRSVLDPAIIAQANAPDRELRRLESTRANITNEDFAALYDVEDEDDDASVRVTGSVLGWERSDEVASIGVLYIVLSLILVDSRIVRDHEMRQLLKRLRLGSGTQMPLSARSTASLSVDQLLSTWVRQGYLDRQRVGEPGKGKRGRGGVPAASQVPNGNATNEEQWEWRWGPRAHAEVSEKAMARFVAEFMVDMELKGAAAESDEDAEDEDAGRGEDWRKRVERVYNGVERAAAGAALQGIK
ncbi:MAGE family-domain-containing protein [Fomitopsis serialis]|uniref:MAGE family-domain-containing protein n=1 Tax=Fomitopsis serialis TaxID=139415 RepID=UPI002007D18F|nr:MAGE family-domain-containing protein [Neoantrodia serialis]KAH9917722.1 MAGE family-domain-containing protein [Neoantrodia serialis]